MNLLDKKVIIFDLDGTLAESRQAPDQEMATLLATLLEKYIVAVISGGAFSQFEKQLLATLHLTEEQKKNLYIFPTSGAVLYRWNGTKWELHYEERFDDEEVQKITAAIVEVMHELDIKTEERFGTQIENRGTQVTFSGLGKDAPLELKYPWDPDQKIRTTMRDKLITLLPDFEINIGGTTSIDITKKSVNKTFAIRRFADYLHIPIEQMIFIGDALYPGGNDAVVKETGIETISVAAVKDTKNVILNLISK